MRVLALVAVYSLIGCSSPTAPSPTPIASPPVSVTAPVAPAPVVTTPAPNPLLVDPRFDLAFYRQFVRNGFEQPGQLEPLRRQSSAPRLYLRTIDDSGAAIDAVTLEATSTAVQQVTAALTGAFGVAGIERGTESREGQSGWITVRWSTAVDGACGRAVVGGDLLTLYPRSPNCRCVGGPAIKPLIIKHEMGHALGFWHTDSVDDLMHNGGHTACDMDPSARERFHAALAYTKPIGSLDP